MYIFYKKNCISCSLFFSANQKEISIMIDYSIKTITIIAPIQTPVAFIKQRLKKSISIISQKQKYLQLLLFNSATSYDERPTYCYFGKRYITCTLRSDFEFVKLYRGIIYVYIKHPSNKRKVKALLTTWSKQRAYIKFNARLNECLLNFNIAQKNKLYYINLKVLYLKNKFFYYDSQNYTLLLNSTLTKLPIFFIDYIIYHSLCTIANITQSCCLTYQVLQSVIPKNINMLLTKK